MKKFKFRLDKILTLRNWTENEAKIELGRAVQALAAIENEIAALAVKRNTAAQNFSKNAGTDIKIYDNYIKLLDIQTEKLQKDAAEASLIVEQKRGEWIASKADVKVMENLKDRKLKEYKKQAYKG